MPQRRIKQLPADALAEEFGREKASALGRLGRALEAALAALAEFDAGYLREASAAEDRQLRASLVAEASVVLRSIPGASRPETQYGWPSRPIQLKAFLIERDHAWTSSLAC